MSRLAEKVAFVTGGSSGSGRAAARLFADEGATVMVADIDAAGGESIVQEIADAGGTATFIHTDITVEADVAAAFDEVRSTHGRLHVLMNCAGGSSRDDSVVTELDMDVFDRVLAFNLKGTVLCCRYGIPLIRESGGGSVVNVSSAVASRGGMLPADSYIAAKGGVIALTRSIAANYAQYGIRANVIVPDMILSPRIVDGGVGVSGSLDTGTVKALYIEDRSRYPLLPGQPIDLANIALFLASDESRLMSGATVPADGGTTNW